MVSYETFIVDLKNWQYWKKAYINEINASTKKIGIWNEFQWVENNGFGTKPKEEPVFIVTPLY